MAQSHLPLRRCDACSGLVPTDRTSCPNCDHPVALPRKTVGAALVQGAVGVAAASAFSMVLMACYGLAMVELQPCPDGTDKDGDGHKSAGHPEGDSSMGGAAGRTCERQANQDCDDSDPNAFPGAPDAFGDGKDTNCDDNDGEPCAQVDKDGDGVPYFDPGPNPQMPNCWFPPEAFSEDCDDDDPMVKGPCDPN